MESFVKNFIRSSLLWLGLGVLLGLGMAVDPYHMLPYRPAHMHANLLGFVAMMIFGVAYHVVPRFVNAPLHSRKLAAAHLFVSNAGLALMVSGWLTRVYAAMTGAALLGTGAVLSAVGAFMFITNIWRTLGSGAPPIMTGIGRANVARQNVQTESGR